MDYFQLILMPIIGAFIGWSTNLLAIKLIFRPLKPFKIPLIKMEVQGLIPKRRFDISKSIGETLEEEILSPDEIVDKLTSEKVKNQILSYIKNLIREKSYERLPAFIPQGFKVTIAGYLGDIIDRHGSTIFDELKQKLIQKAKSEINIKEMVEEKINSLDLEQLENLIIKLSQKELKQIEILGGVIGFFVGLIQAAASCYISFFQ